jgi:hypothetical protein
MSAELKGYDMPMDADALADLVKEGGEFGEGFFIATEAAIQAMMDIYGLEVGAAEAAEERGEDEVVKWHRTKATAVAAMACTFSRVARVQFSLDVTVVEAEWEVNEGGGGEAGGVLP